MAFADLRGLRLQGLTLVRRALASAAAVGQPSLKAVLLAACAHLEHRLDLDAAAVDTAHDALALAVAPDDLEARLMALKVLGMASMRLGLAAQQALAVQVPALQLLCGVVLARFQAAMGEPRAALATFDRLDAHPAAQAVVRQEVARFRAALRQAHPQAQAGAWQGPELEALINRLIDEAGQSFEPLRRLLRSGAP